MNSKFQSEDTNFSLAIPLSNSSLVSPCGFTTTYEAMSKWNIGMIGEDRTAKM